MSDVGCRLEVHRAPTPVLTNIQHPTSNIQRVPNDRRPPILVSNPERTAVRTGGGGIPVPPQHHHHLHVDRAHAERREPQLHRFLLPAQTSRRPPLHLL